ncbi:MAG: exo-alpha-sialidase [Phycisphaerae bacterium]
MSDRIHVATRKGLFTIERTAAGWSVARTAFLGDNCSMVLQDARDGTTYLACDHGHFGVKLHRSRDDGETWAECSVPIYPEKPADYEDLIDAMHPQAYAWSLKLIWALAPGAANEPGVVWAGTAPGGLFRSTDGGGSWEMIRSLWDEPKRREWFGGGYDYPGIHSICVDPRNARRIILGVSCGGVWVTEDAGKTWACRADGMRAEYMPPERAHEPYIQDAHCVVQCPAQPEVFWAQHHNGIFRSTDDLKSWKEIQGAVSSFGFPVAVHPREADTAWFVPGVKDECRIPAEGKLVVTRTRDGGKTFDVLREGLPQQHAYDLVFRHALDVDESGDRLVFGSTTGSLWVSENQGDSWQCVSTHLPPIHCTRFVKTPSSS